MNKYSIIIIAGISVLLSFVSVAHSTNYDYDSLNRLTKVTYDGGFQISYSYDAVGNRIERTAKLQVINFTNFAVFAAHWLQSGCGEPDFCNGADLDGNSQVDYNDLALFAQHWLEGVGP